MADSSLEDPRLAGTLEAAIAAAIPETTAVYLFGSLAAGHGRPGSDVDLAVLIEPPLDADRKLRVCESLAEALGRDVDLIERLGDFEAYTSHVLRNLTGD